MPRHTPDSQQPASCIYATCSGDECQVSAPATVHRQSVRVYLPSWMSCLAATLTGVAGAWACSDGFWPAGVLAAPVIVVWLVLAIDSAMHS